MRPPSAAPARRRATASPHACGACARCNRGASGAGTPPGTPPARTSRSHSRTVTVTQSQSHSYTVEQCHPCANDGK
eukprot:57121-Prorocentrum_minimum.AAC.1